MMKNRFLGLALSRSKGGFFVYTELACPELNRGAEVVGLTFQLI